MLFRLLLTVSLLADASSVPVDSLSDDYESYGDAQVLVGDEQAAPDQHLADLHTNEMLSDVEEMVIGQGDDANSQIEEQADDLQMQSNQASDAEPQVNEGTIEQSNQASDAEPQVNDGTIEQSNQASDAEPQVNDGTIEQSNQASDAEPQVNDGTIEQSNQASDAEPQVNDETIEQSNQVSDAEPQVNDETIEQSNQASDAEPQVNDGTIEQSNQVSDAESQMHQEGFSEGTIEQSNHPSYSELYQVQEGIIEQPQQESAEEVQMKSDTQQEDEIQISPTNPPNKSSSDADSTIIIGMEERHEDDEVRDKNAVSQEHKNAEEQSEIKEAGEAQSATLETQVDEISGNTKDEASGTAELEETPTKQVDDYASALRDLGEAVRSLLPLREYMTVAAECREEREAAMQAVISEMRGRMIQLERQANDAREAERECQLESQALRALGVEKKLADCQARLEERQAPNITAVVRVEVVNRKYNEDDDEGDAKLPGAPLVQLVNLLEKVSTRIVHLVDGLDNRMSDIHSISRETLKFVESVQESESEDAVQNDEVARLSALVNSTEAALADLRNQLHIAVETVRATCRNNITAVQNECSNKIFIASAAARAQCDAESAKLQGERLAYIVGLHAEHNSSLLAAREHCREEVQREMEFDCDARIVAKEVECREACSVHTGDSHDELSVETNATLAAMQANCDDRLTELQERCDAEMRLIGMKDPAIDVRSSFCVNEAPAEPILTHKSSDKCEGFDQRSTTLIEPVTGEVSIRLGNKLYIISSEKNLNQEEAWQACRDRAMWLLSVETKKEQTDLMQRIQMLLAVETDVEVYSLWTSAYYNGEALQWRCGAQATSVQLEQDASDELPNLVMEFPRRLGGQILWRNARSSEKHQLACEVTLQEA